MQTAWLTFYCITISQNVIFLKKLKSRCTNCFGKHFTLKDNITFVSHYLMWKVVYCRPDNTVNICQKLLCELAAAVILHGLYFTDMSWFFFYSLLTVHLDASM